VTDPIDAAKYIVNPCAMLTPSQIAAFGFEGPGEPRQGARAMCTWHTVGSHEGINISFTTNKMGLTDTYRTYVRLKDSAYWEPTTVAGYPGVFESVSDGRADGDCDLVVGVRDDLSFGIRSSSSKSGAGCDRIKEVAGAMIATMKAGV
jgi:hypothetical protein